MLANGDQVQRCQLNIINESGIGQNFNIHKEMDT